MNSIQFILLVLLLALSVQLTRWLPFVIFGRKSELPPIIDYFGKVLPAAMMGLLVVYCFKDVDITDMSSLVPWILGSAAVALIHLWKRNTILSIAAGTLVYMLFLNIM